MGPKARIPRRVQQVPEAEVRASAVVVVSVLLLSSILDPRAVAEVALRNVAAELFAAASLPAVLRRPMCLVPLDQSCVAVQP